MECLLLICTYPNAKFIVIYKPRTLNDGGEDSVKSGRKIQKSQKALLLSSPSMGLTNLAKPYHVHYHLSQPDMAGQNTGARRGAPASMQRFALLADVRGNKTSAGARRGPSLSATLRAAGWCPWEQGLFYFLAAAILLFIGKIIIAW